MTGRNSFLADPTQNRPSPRLRWDSRYAACGDHALPPEPRQFLVDWLPRLPSSGLALDIAAGAGRHSLALARHGLAVHAVDISFNGLSVLASRTPKDAGITPIVLDLERGWLPKAKYDVIVNFLFLERAIFPMILRRLRPDGWLVMETFTVEQLTLPHKAHLRRHFLLEKQELFQTFAGLEMVFYEEGLFNGNYTARMVARKK